MPRTISIVGAGRVGKTLGKCLHRLGWRIGAVVARSDAHAKAVVHWIGAGMPRGRVTGDVFEADVILLATPDDVLEQVAARLARTGGKAGNGNVVLHTSGALDSSVLSPLARLGAATGSLHPMQTFTGREVPKLNGVIFTVEGDPTARRVAQRIARQLGGVPVTIDAKSKAAYHAAGALVAGHALALIEAATRILMRCGFTRRRAMQAVLPLTRQMLDNFERLGPQTAWTGPIARGDYAIVQAHGKALRAYPREFQQAYAALALLAGRVLAKDSKVTIAGVKRALKNAKRRLF
jgi:predicted short-subunit dehydrogenase-like oxidoreductase (DUF2520 family)